MKPLQGEKNVDLQSWIAKMAETMHVMAKAIGNETASAMYYNHFQQIMQRMDLFWNEKIQYYVDIAPNVKAEHVGVPGKC